MSAEGKQTHSANKQNKSLASVAPKTVAPAADSVLAELSPPEWLNSVPDHATNRQQRQAAVLQMQRTHGNAYVQRLLDRRLIQRDNGDDAPQPAQPSSEPSGEQPELTEVTVPVPEQQRRAAETATGSEGGAPAAAPSTEAAPTGEQTAQEPPPVPEEARVRVPVDFDFSALPPEIQIRFLEEFQFTATVTAASLAWQRRQFQLSLGYEYGGAISGSGSFQTDAGTFSGSAAYDPSSEVGTFGAGWRQDRWTAGMSATTEGQFGASLQYGATLPPFATDPRFGPPLPGMFPDMSRSIPAGEAGVRGLAGAVPGVIDDPGSVIDVVGEHEEDISGVSGAAGDIGRVVDLTERDTTHIDWGFYLRFMASPDSGVSLVGGAGVLFKRDPGAPAPALIKPSEGK